jgi:hypothetical protein
MVSGCQWQCCPGLVSMAAAVMVAGLVGLVTMADGTQPTIGPETLENFEQYAGDGFPARWRANDGEARNIYRVESEAGNRFLRARSKNQGVQIGLEHVFNPTHWRRFGWRWRVHEFPRGADERVGDKHDAAAQVYIIFDNQYRPRVIKYIWSGSVPAQSRFINPLYSRGRVVVLRSGAAEKNKWVEEEVSFYDDYKKFFGATPGDVQGIAVLSSSDSTRSTASADYDDFTLLP